MITQDDKLALVLIQQVYFDLCDVLNGDTFKDLGYNSKREFFEVNRDRLAEIEDRLFKGLELA